MGIPSVVAVPDHSRDPKPTVSQSVTPVDLLARKSGHSPQHSPAGQHRFFRVIFGTSCDSKDCKVSYRLVHARNPANRIVIV
jgi:hypothetical protein